MDIFSLVNLILLAANLLICSFAQEAIELPKTHMDEASSSLSRSSFPKDFLFGSASTAYQYEGAVKQDGREPSIWDEFTHKYPDKILDGSNGDVTEDFYDRYKDDIKLMKSFGLDSFRLSISWSRVLPYGKLSKGVNTKGIEFYNNLINELLTNGIEPFVTIFHWDTPQTLQDEYGGFLSTNIVIDYRDFAELCFKEFGDRVGQKSQIGISLCSSWMVPYSNSISDSMAAQRALDFTFGWFMDPLTYGQYPKIMRKIVGNRMPYFTTEEATLVKGSYDFLGINYYTGNYVSDVPLTSDVLSAATDPQVIQTFERNGESIGQPTGGPKFYVYPEGLRYLLLYTKETYRDPTIYITENGMPDSNNLTTAQLIKDTQRIDFLQSHFLAMEQAIKDGVNLQGYFVWSFLDTWEWNSGYTLRFGLTFVDYQNGLTRIHKHSGLWLKNFLKPEEKNNSVQL